MAAVELFKGIHNTAQNSLDYEKLILDCLQGESIMPPVFSFQEIRDFVQVNTKKQEAAQTEEQKAASAPVTKESYNEKECLRKLQELVKNQRVSKHLHGFVLPDRLPGQKKRHSPEEEEYHEALATHIHDLFYQSCWSLHGSESSEAEISSPQPIRVAECVDYAAQFDVLLVACEARMSYITQMFEECCGIALKVHRPADLFVPALIPEAFFLQIATTPETQQKFHIFSSYYDGCGKDAWVVVLEEDDDDKFSLHSERFGAFSEVSEWTLELTSTVSLSFQQFQGSPPSMPSMAEKRASRKP